MSQAWIQVYDPIGNPWLSTAAAALPIVLLLVALAVFEWRAHIAALSGLVAALAIAMIVFGMPLRAALATAAYGAGQIGQEGRILRFVFWHSIALATIMASIVMLQAYVFPWMIPKIP